MSRSAMDDQHQHQRQAPPHRQNAFYSSNDHPPPSSSNNPLHAMSVPMPMPLFPFAPLSPSAHPVSTSPLSMSILTNLMQNIQGGDPQSSAPSQNNNNSAPHSQQPPYSPQMLLEHQFKITQLQQLQHLQNQIFQQQIALISGQSPPTAGHIDSASPIHRADQGAFASLPTPAPSTEIRPSQPTSMDFVSPMALSNSFLDPHSSSSSSSHQHQHQHQHSSSSQSHSQSHHFREHSFASPLPDHPMGSYTRNHHHAHSFDMPHSAPEHIAFRTSPGRELDIDISPLTSPWLGAHSSSSSFHQQQPQTHLQPLRTGVGNKRPSSPSGDESSAPSRKKPQSPAIRAQNPNPSSSSARGRRLSKSTTSTPLLRSTRGNSAREFTIGEVVGDTPSPVDLAMPPPAPPTQQLSLTPINTNSVNPGYTMPMNSNGNLQNGSNNCSSSSSASDGTIPNTPVSPAFGPAGTSFDTNATDTGQYDAQMDATFSETSSPAFGATAAPTTNSYADTSSSAFTSAAPSTFNVDSFNNGNAFPQPVPQAAIGSTAPAPATPASMMNLGRLGTSSGLTPPQGRATVEKGKTRSAATSASGKAKKSSVGASPGLKAILPAGPTAPPQLTDPSPLPGPVLAVKKTSHKHAEQKRRDSLKSTFDDLRHLLPPIALPTEPDAPVLPGALPPRGPPKAGTEGPNKAVSKLQLLICGNEYIRTLKGRVERRDDEIQKLRKEVGRLRGEVGRLKGMVGDDTSEHPEEEVDLEKDLDAVEALRPSFGRLGMGSNGQQDDDDGDE